MIEIEKPGKPGKEDEYFSRKPQSSTVEQQIEKHRHEGQKQCNYKSPGIYCEKGVCTQAGKKSGESFIKRR